MNRVCVNMELCELWIYVNDRWSFMNNYTVIFRLIMHVMYVIVSTVYVGMPKQNFNFSCHIKQSFEIKVWV